MMLKYLIPFERFTIQSPLSCADALTALQKDMGPPIWSSLNNVGYDFHGIVEDGTFRIRRVVGSGNAFLPVVIGRVEPALGGCVAKIHMRADFVSMVFSAVLLSVFFSTLFVLVCWLIVDSDGAVKHQVLPFGLSVTLVAGTNGVFWSQAHQQKKILKAIFEQKTPRSNGMGL